MKAHFRLIAIIITAISFQLAVKAQPIGTAIIHDKLTMADSIIYGQRMKMNTLTSVCSAQKLIVRGISAARGFTIKPTAIQMNLPVLNVSMLNLKQIVSVNCSLLLIWDCLMHQTYASITLLIPG